MHPPLHTKVTPRRARVLAALVFTTLCTSPLTNPATAETDMSQFQFKPHVIDTTLESEFYAQTALADFDNDGRLEYLLGRRGGELYIYKSNRPDDWTRHQVGKDSPSDVGACAVDVDGDGWIDIVTGGAWYRNSRDLDKPFERIVFDPQLNKVHDVLAADINGDGRKDILTMSDQNNVRWYDIGEDPTRPWARHDIGPAVHAGLAVGDLDGDGDLDLVRTDIWFENVKGDGTEWAEHKIGPNTPPPPDFRPPFAFDATRAVVCDMNGDGKQDVVFTDAEIPGGKVWWMQNMDGTGRNWKRHEVFDPESEDRKGPRRGAYHTLAVEDFDGEGDLDILSCEMEAVGGEDAPRWYIWENVDGKGGKWAEHVILDQNLGGHEAVVGDVTGNGKLDIVAKPWAAADDNAEGGKMFVIFLENVSK